MTGIARIKILPPALASQIAAGEVVERPASVVKELVENALDAEAAAIEIEISLARRRIRVKDDGHGIAPDEVELALSRHGTSKVGDAADIFGIGTYGFRGEALPSIASVSRLTLTSHRAGNPAGRRIAVEGGETLRIEDAPPLKGTEVLVENLFYNTPARRKFTRSDAAEMGQITAKVVQAALSAPAVRFNFIKDGKRVLELPPAPALLERVRQVFGADYAQNLVPVAHKEFNIAVGGLVGKPEFTRATGIDQYFFINGRPVKDMLIRSAVLRAFEDLLPKGRKPVVFLNISMPLEVVDVNVHPAKAEVRLADPGKVSEAIVKAIRGAFGRSATAYAPPGGAAQAGGDFAAPGGSPAPHGDGKAAFVRTFELWRPAPSGEGPAAAVEGGGQLQLENAHGRLSPDAAVIGQAFDTFLLFEEGDRIVIMDQHTVHERVLYERFMKRYLEHKVERQGVLVPVTFSTDPRLAEVIRAHAKTFAGMGWGLEEFGEREFVIREVPAILEGKEFPPIITEMAQTLADGRDEDYKDVMADCVSRIACRAAVKAGDTLNRGEIAELAKELARTALPYTCPHGRPIAFSLSRGELWRFFNRGR
ncbi:MAG: DNA mismatch repair endonuclease MutL [Nitrospinae bacterium]|nr:DNA mismatch repair endonuclease MutL [Nitrospinota bacterium]